MSSFIGNWRSSCSSLSLSHSISFLFYFLLNIFIVIFFCVLIFNRCNYNCFSLQFCIYTVYYIYCLAETQYGQRSYDIVYELSCSQTMESNFNFVWHFDIFFGIRHFFLGHSRRVVCFMRQKLVNNNQIFISPYSTRDLITINKLFPYCANTHTEQTI